jgi:hypothetical protein
MGHSAINGISDENWLNKLDISKLMLKSFHRKKKPYQHPLSFKVRNVRLSYLLSMTEQDSVI